MSTIYWNRELQIGGRMAQTACGRRMIMDKKENMQTTPVNDADMPIEEYRRRLAESEQRARAAESDAAILRECIVRMALERYGVLQ
jgi:DNA-directed RNA polymerase subunit N (RpoN/RPB10)